MVTVLDAETTKAVVDYIDKKDENTGGDEKQTEGQDEVGALPHLLIVLTLVAGNNLLKKVVKR